MNLVFWDAYEFDVFSRLCFALKKWTGYAIMFVLYQFSFVSLWTSLCFLFISPLQSLYYSLVKQLNATGRPDENFSIEVNGGPLFFTRNEAIQDVRLLSVFLQKGQLRSNICYHPENLSSLEVQY